MPTPAQRLIYAVRTGNYQRLGELLRAEGAAAELSKAYRTALHAAAEEGDLEAARMLLEAGADVNARMDDGKPQWPKYCGNMARDYRGQGSSTIWREMVRETKCFG
jgi:ankyrin repeat protein